MGYPAVVKPNAEGSTIGVSIADNIEELEKGIAAASLYDRRILIEKYISGRELTVGVIGKDPVALPVIEIKPKSGFFDYESKYTKNLTQYIVPVKIKNGLNKKILDFSLKCHKEFNCSGISRAS